MTFPDWFKPSAYGAATGAVLTAIVGFSWGGWMTSSSAAEMANMQAHQEVTAALMPMCLERARLDPDRMTTLSAIKDARSFDRPRLVMETGWATAPGAADPDRDLALACIVGLDLDAT